MDEARIPKLPKIPFIVADVLLVVTAIIIANSGSGPLNPVMFFWIIFCVALGGVLACLPFYVEYKNSVRLAEYDLSQANLENAERIEAVMAGIGQIGESIREQSDRSGHAVATIEGLIGRLDSRLSALEEREEEERQKDDPLPGMVENLASQINSSIGSLVRELKASLSAGQSELRDLLAKTSVDMRESLDRVAAETTGQLEADIAAELSALATRIDRLTAIQSSPNTEHSVHSEETETLAEGNDDSETTSEETGTEAPVIEDDWDELEDSEETPAEEDSRTEVDVSFLPEEDEVELKQEEVIEPDTENNKPIDNDALTSREEAPQGGVEASPDEGAVSSPEPVAPKITPAEASLDSESADDSDEATDEELSEAETKTEDAQPNLLDEMPEGSAKARKAGRKETSLVAQVLIGIGNKPYVRGTGSGLSEDKGVPMEFLEIGKWQWVAPNPSEPVTLRIYKNDKEPADGEAIRLEPGQKRVITPRFG